MTSMLAFITTLRHPANSVDYGRVEDLLQQSLQSICHQTDDTYVVIVVGNVRPSCDLPPQVRFVQVDFPPPAAVSGRHASMNAFVYDKGTKVGVGLVVAGQLGADMVMLFDADDFVSKRVAEFATTGGAGQTWVVERGYMLSASRYSFRAIDEFQRTCGTSFLVPFERYRVPQSLAATSSQGQIAEAFEGVLTHIMGAHLDATEWFAADGSTPRPFPFPAAVYHVDTGENHSGKGMYGIARPVSRRFAREFGVPRARFSPRQLLLSFGPRPCAQSAMGRVRLRRMQVRQFLHRG